MLKQRSGLVLGRDRNYLVGSRLTPVAHKNGLPSVEDLLASVRDRRDERLANEIIEAMTTNETFFFRDGHPFDQLRDQVIPKFKESRRDKKLRIWCAAASTGQEPFSVAMLLKEMGLDKQGWKIEILGTDISKESLARARSGRFSQFEVQRGLPIQMLVKYFTQEDNFWVIQPEIMGMVSYREFNLLNEFHALGRFDVIFCRNVLIYFEPKAKGDILARMRRQMPDDGVLILGGSETVLGITEDFSIVPGKRGLYAPAC